MSTPEEWTKYFEQSWANFKELEYIDLLSFWCVSKENQVEASLSDDENGMMASALRWKKEGKIKHIGFSTHGTADVIMRMIESNKFDYVNLHYHYFGSYHAEGTPDTKGGHGNLACVKRALELDMGVFNISPVDKGGRLYQPSKQVARAIGPKLTPIAFACLYSWSTAGMHTVSVGFARPEDLTEVLEAAALFDSIQQKKSDHGLRLLEGATNRLDSHMRETLGKKWAEKGLIGIPGQFEKKTNCISLGHTLWCYNLLFGFGMYDMAKARYKNLVTETKKWSKKKTFEENLKGL